MNQFLPSSRDQRDLSPDREYIFPKSITFGRKTLKDNLNPRVSLIIQVLDLATNNPLNNPTVCPPNTIITPTILNKKGQIDPNKIAESIIQSNMLISRSLNTRNMEMSQQFYNYQQYRIFEKPPKLKNLATYLDYYNWIDPMLANLTRHPDFRYQFLMYRKPATSTPEDQLRLDQVYSIIKDKLDYSISENPKLIGLVACHPSPDEISSWWLLLQAYFFPNSESDKQSRELRFYGLIQRVDEPNDEFIQRVFLEAEILKYCHQEVSESRLRLCILSSLTDKVHREYAALQDHLRFPEWIDYVVKLERIHKPNRVNPFKIQHVKEEQIPLVSSIESKYNIDSNKIVDSKESSVNYSNQQRHGNKFKKKVYTKPPSSKVANPNTTCYLCRGKGHYQANCPFRTRSVTDLIREKSKNQRREQMDRSRRSSQNRNENENENESNQRFQHYKDMSVTTENPVKDEKDVTDDSINSNFVGVITHVKESLPMLNNVYTPQTTNNPILDSGATRHMFNNLAHFTSFMPRTDSQLQVEVAQGTRVPALGTGSVGPLKDVLYIPDLKFSIISISVLDELNYHILFGRGIVKVYDSNDKLFLTGIKNDRGLYELQQNVMEQCFQLTPIVCVVHQFSNNPYLNVHACLGHASARRTKYVCQCNKMKGIKSLSQNAFDCIKNCTACKLAKSTKRSFPGHFETPTTAGVSWQFDVKGKIEVPSLIYNAHYEFGFIDRHSRKLFTYYTSNKDSQTTINVLITWFKNVIVPIRASNPSVTKIFLHSDLGELNSDAVKNCALQHGIYLTFTSSYTPELNSIIERVWRTITESSVAMLIHAKLSEFYWQFARQTAVYIYNAIPGAHPEDQAMSPDERFYSRKTNVQHLQVFGTVCYVNIMNKQKNHQAKSQKGIFVGYPLDQPFCYKVLLTGPPPRVIVSTHVNFVNDTSLTHLPKSQEPEKSSETNVPTNFVPTPEIPTFEVPTDDGSIIDTTKDDGVISDSIKDTHSSENLEDSLIQYRPEYRPEKPTTVGSQLYQGDDLDDSSPECRPEK